VTVRLIELPPRSSGRACRGCPGRRSCIASGEWDVPRGPSARRSRPGPGPREVPPPSARRYQHRGRRGATRSRRMARLLRAAPSARRKTSARGARRCGMRTNSSGVDGQSEAGAGAACCSGCSARCPCIRWCARCQPRQSPRCCGRRQRARQRCDRGAEAGSFVATLSSVSSRSGTQFHSFAGKCGSRHAGCRGKAPNESDPLPPERRRGS